MNEGVDGDEEGEWTYTEARGESVIDYIIVEEGLAGDIKRIEVGGQVDSDHHPVGVWIRGGGEETVRGGERRGRGGRGCWDEVGREEFRKVMRGWELGGGEVQEEIE